MADTKTSDESAIGAGLDGTEEIRLAKAGANYKATVNELLALVGGTDITLSALQTLQAAGTMTPGWYHITDRDIWVEALNGNSISPNGKRLMYCPATYAQTTDGDGNVWLGVWNSGLSPTVGDLAIWGGKVWKQDSGGVGTAIDDFTLSSEWVLVDKTSFTNNEYIQLSFGCSFDIVNDWVSKQWDDKGNIHGIDYLEQSTLYSFPENPCDFNDWNLETSGAPYNDNNCISVFNNTTAIYNSTSGYVSYPIHNNSSLGMIYNNKSTVIYNHNNGNISGNITNNGIINNANNGNIAGCTCSDITSNSNNGNILNCTSLSIKHNSNGGNISGNSNTGLITGCTCAGGINNFDNTFVNITYCRDANTIMAFKTSVNGAALATTALKNMAGFDLTSGFVGAFATFSYVSGTLGIAVVKIKNSAGDNSALIPLGSLTSTQRIVVQLTGTWANSGNISVEVTTASAGASAFFVKVYGQLNNTSEV